MINTARYVDDHGLILFNISFMYAVNKNPKTPNLSPMAEVVITQGNIQGLGFPLSICVTLHNISTIIMATDLYLLDYSLLPLVVAPDFPAVAAAAVLSRMKAAEKLQ